MVLELSGLSMLFVDRVFVGQRSVIELNAVVVAGTSAWAVVDTLTILTEAVSVRVAQRRGAGQDGQVGRAVWPMIWVSLATPLVFVPLAALAPALFGGAVGAEPMVAYFQWLLWLGPVMGLRGAMAGLLVGLGETRMLLWAGLLGGVVNFTLDAALIGSVGDPNALGVQGAALATMIGAGAQAAFLAGALLRGRTWSRLGLSRLGLDAGEFAFAMRMGTPVAALAFVEMLGYAAFHLVYRNAVSSEVAVAAVAQSILIPFLFLYIGVMGATTSVAGHHAGAGQYLRTRETLRAGLTISLLGGVIVAVLLGLFGTVILRVLDVSAADLGPPWMTGAILVLVALKVVSASASGVVHGLLAGAGRTRTVLFVGTIATAMFLVLPAMALRHAHVAMIVAVGLWVIRDLAFCGLGGVFYTRLLQQERKKETHHG